MKIGDYIRTKDGVIAKIEDIIADYSIDCDRDVFHAFSNNAPDVMEIPYALKDEYIIKHSPNIIDLIEIGDYVNGLKVAQIIEVDEYKVILMFGLVMRLGEEDIKTIVTKEQFESMEYRIGD